MLFIHNRPIKIAICIGNFNINFNIVLSNLYKITKVKEFFIAKIKLLFWASKFNLII